MRNFLFNHNFNFIPENITYHVDMYFFYFFLCNIYRSQNIDINHINMQIFSYLTWHNSVHFSVSLLSGIFHYETAKIIFISYFLSF